jgi:hypothetical protein
MLRNRILVLLGVCFLAASAAWADEVGYVDCSNHSDATQVFGKPRRTPEVVGSLPCGERFTILVYGFYFSRIQTKDGQIGYIYSSLIAVDRGATASQQTPSMQTAAEKTKIPSTRSLDAKPALPTPPQPQPAPAQPAPTPAISSPAPVSSTSISSSSAAPVSASTVTETTAAPVAQPDPPVVTQPAAAQPQPASTQPAPAASPEIASPVPTPTPSETPASVTQPEPAATAPQPDPPAQPAPQPQPAPAQPAPAIRPADTRDTWERPNPSVRTAPLIELYGGYGFTRTVSGGSSTNLNGALGSFGWNFKPWLQIVGDSSYSFVTVGGTKNVLYGNHYGPRFFYRAQNRWRLTPFAEALVGGSRADTTVSGAGGYTASQNSLSYKVGGGIDFRPSRRWEIRLFDFDYYRTSFGTNAHQNNYSASTGIVLRLFGGRSE